MTSTPHEPAPDMLNVYKVTPPDKAPTRLTAMKVTALVAALLAILFVGAAAGAYALSKDDILPQVSVAGISLAGLDRAAATELLQTHFTAMIDKGFTVTLYNDTAHVDLQASAANDPDLIYQLIDWDINASVDQALAIGHTNNALRDFFAPLYHATLAPVNIAPTFALAETRLETALHATFPTAESPGTPTDFVITGPIDEPVITVTEAVEGSTLDTEAALRTLITEAQDLQLEPIKLRLIERSAVINALEAETLVSDVERALTQAPYALTFTPEYGSKLTYTVTADNLRTWLLPSKDDAGQPTLSFSLEDMQEFLDAMHTAIDIAPKDAVFVMEGNRVTDFQPSYDGFLINEDKLLADLAAALGTDNQSVAIATEQTAPAITTASSNDLGIAEILGIGTSNYSGSPSNRRANIRHGADKLNGLLVAPGETLSLIEHLKPFTIADGYLPELVIKGDKIIPEIGGGLCQIGTTTFRAALNSGLDIVERRNHSLVISYYNDPSNNQPGTDATLYDPAPDLKIKNDTANYILLVTTVVESGSQLEFAFWGTSDGREGSYTPPVVLTRTSPGATVEKITSALPPGVRRCDAPHAGATTTFDYNIVMPDGTVKTREFFSTYRSLPSTCLVGAAVAASGTPTDPGPLEVSDAVIN